MNIRDWYDEGCNFYQGVMLLRSRGIDTSSFDAYLNESYIPSAKRQLLENALLSMPEKPVKLPSAPLLTVATVHAQPLQEPNTITSLRDRAKLLHKKHAAKHAQLHSEANEAKRLDIIIEIMEDIIPSLDSIYDAIREYQNTGVLPVDETPVSEKNYETGLHEGVVKFQQLMNIKSRISKLDGKNGLIAIEKDNDRKKRLQAELADKIQIRDALIRELNLDETT